MSSATDIRVLVVSSAEEVIAELREALAAAGHGLLKVDAVSSAGDAIVALRDLPSEVTLVDVGNGDPTRIRMLETVSSTTADTALIAIAADRDDRLAVRTLELGAQDCLTRGTDDLEPGHLARALRNALVRSAHDGSRPLATLIELSSDAIMTMNRDRVITRFNGAAERVYGWRASEVLGKRATLLVPEEDHAKQSAFVDRVLDGESVDAFETTRQMRDGRTVVMSMAGSPIVDAFGNVIEACLIIRDVTDQVNARLQLSEQRHLLESSQAAGHIGSWSVDRLTGRIDWSAEHYRLLRRDPALGPASLEELLELVHPDDRPRVQNSFHREAGFIFEARFVADAEDVRILRVIGEYIPREDGSPGRLLGITQDVTDERAEQAARRLAEEQLERAFDEALIGMAILDTNRYMVRVNNALCELLGYTRKDLLATTLQALTHPDDVGDDLPVMRLMQSGAQQHHVREKRYIHADGHIIWAEVGVSLIFEADGSVRHNMVQVQDITERRAHMDHLRHMADHDPLTGLLNRRGFDRELAAHIARAQRYGVTGALLLFDLDNFKLHNDTYGHAAGDDLLVALAEGLRKRLRATDVIGRRGGDEFAVLLPDAGHTRAGIVTRSLLEHIDGITERISTVATSRVTASIGLVCFERLPRLSADEALQCADQAMYRAKGMGRNCFTEWEQPPADRAAGPAGAVVPDAVMPGAAVPEVVVPDAVVPDAVAPEVVVPEPVTPDAVTPETVTPASD